MSKQRLDLLLVERGLAETRAKAQALIMAGQVRVDDQVELKASTAVLPEARVEVVEGPRFVSRGGEKLGAALEAFSIEVHKRICADVGASTGGFTDCLLQHGAARVYAIDVGKGILHWKLRSDPRVVVMEQTNARFVKALPEPVSLVTIDASFISLKILLPVVKGWTSPQCLGARSSTHQASELTGDPSPLTPLPKGEGKEESLSGNLIMGEGEVIALIKPQFEAGRKEAARNKGVIRDPLIHRSVLLDVLAFAQAQGFSVKGLIRSPIMGPKGNVEFLVWLGVGGEAVDIRPLVEKALEAA